MINRKVSLAHRSTRFLQFCFKIIQHKAILFPATKAQNTRQKRDHQTVKKNNQNFPFNNISLALQFTTKETIATSCADRINSKQIEEITAVQTRRSENQYNQM